MKKNFVIIFAVIFVTTAVAQYRSVGNDKRMIPDVTYVAPHATKPTLEGVNSVGETFIQTDFDYGGNNVIPKMISLADIDATGSLDPFFVGMKRDNAASVNPYIAFGYKAFGAPIDYFSAFDPSLLLGWGTTQLISGGAHDGQALVMASAVGGSHYTWIDLVNLAPITPFPTATFGTSAPDFVYNANGEIWTLNTDAMIRKSTDNGAIFTDVQLIGTGDANVNLSIGSGPLENPMYGNLTGQYMVTVGSWAEMTVPDSEDAVYWYGTNDGGATWNGLVIGKDGYFGSISNKPNLAPFFENFGQLNANVDENGITHLVMNGYGAGINSVGDTVEAFPILYWNSNASEWLEISIPEIAFEDEAILADLRPGNGIGQSYPSVSVTDDGQFIFVIWTAPEYTGTVGASPINIYTGTNSIFYTDLHWTVSTDGGQTWAVPTKIGEPNVSETYANVARRLEILPNNDVKAHFVFFEDAIPGTSLFPANNENAVGTWRYTSAIIGNKPPPYGIPITFQVDMSVQMFEGNFPPGANVVVRGDFQTDAGDPNGLWQGNMFQLSDTDDDSIYTGTFPMPSNFVGNNYSFKYVIVNPPAGDNWESTPVRQFTLTPPATVLPVVWFNDDGIIYPPIEITNTIVFTADITDFLNSGIGGAFDPNQDSLLVMGLDWDNLGKNVVGNRKMVNDNILPGIYTTTLTVTSGSAAPYGVGDSTNWKFKAYPDSRFKNNGWETGSDRWHIYEADGSVIDLPVIIPRIFPITDTTTIDVDLTINVDMLGAVNRYNGLQIPLSEIEFVGMRGSADFLGNWSTGTGGCWCVDDTLTENMKVLTKISESIWRFHKILPAGTEMGRYQFKFAAMYPGADTVNGGINPLDNENVFGNNHIFLLSNTPTIIRNHSFGSSDPIPSVERIENLSPSDFELEQNYPNPFNPTTKIRYSIPEYSYVTLKVFNLLGEEIETLFNGEQMPGVYEAAFDASNLSSGIYFYTLQTDNFSSSKKMILIK